MDLVVFIVVELKDGLGVIISASAVQPPLRPVVSALFVVVVSGDCLLMLLLLLLLLLVPLYAPPKLILEIPLCLRC